MGKLTNEALSFKLLDSDPKTRPFATKEMREFKHMYISVRSEMVFDRFRNRRT